MKLFGILFGLLFLLVGLGVLAWDVGAALLSMDWDRFPDITDLEALSDHLPLTDVGTFWFQVHRESLLNFEPLVSRYLFPGLWTYGIQVILTWPLSLTLLGFGLMVRFPLTTLFVGGGVLYLMHWYLGGVLTALGVLIWALWLRGMTARTQKFAE